MEPAENTEIDTDFFSRQIGTFGMEAMGKLIKLKVLIVGLRGVSHLSSHLNLKSVEYLTSNLAWIRDCEEPHLGRTRASGRLGHRTSSSSGLGSKLLS